MNLQRREEIRELANWLDSSEWSSATEYQEAMRELLAHIDTLEQTAAERVISRGAAVKPHTFAEIVNQVRDIANQYAGTDQLRERIAYALTPHFERNEGPAPDYTGEGSAWVPPVEERAVVVPEIMLSDISDECSAMLCNDREAFRRGALWAQKFITSRVRATPNDRSLGDVARVLQQFVDWCEKYPSSRTYDYAEITSIARQMDMINEAAKVALRANQGWPAT